MTAPYKLPIEQFIRHFDEAANALQCPGSPLHRKILYSTALDPLARAAYGASLGNKARFTRLVRELSGWSHSERVSLPQLQQRLRAEGRHRQKLCRKIRHDLGLWDSDSKIGLQHSPVADVLVPFAQGNEIKLISECKYSELFYAYRNSLIHEFREPGYGWDIAGTSSKPFYMSYLGNEGQWELVFPVRFFETLLAGTLAGLRAHLIKHKINPYKNFQFGSMWKMA